jgi:hypothetical protein
MNELELIELWKREQPLYEAWGWRVTNCVLKHLRERLGDRALVDVIKIEPRPRTKEIMSFVDKAFHRKTMPIRITTSRTTEFASWCY